MGMRSAGSESRFRRGVAIATGLVAMGGLAVFALEARASPQPTVAQVQAKVNQLTSQYDKVATEQLDQVGEQLSAAQTRLAQVRGGRGPRQRSVPGGAYDGGPDRRGDL